MPSSLNDRPAGSLSRPKEKNQSSYMEVKGGGWGDGKTKAGTSNTIARKASHQASARRQDKGVQ